MTTSAGIPNNAATDPNEPERRTATTEITSSRKSKATAVHSASGCTPITVKSGIQSRSQSGKVRRSFYFGAGQLDHLCPFLDVAAQIFVEFSRAHHHRHRTLLCPILLYVGTIHDLPDFGIELVDDGLWRFGRRHKTEPDRRLVAGHSGFRHGRHIGSDRRALLA